MSMNKQALRAYNWDSDIVDTGAGAYFRSIGLSAVVCTSYALEIQRVLGKERVTIVGFFAEDNPTAGVNMVAEGHDFAIVDERYIVDPWVACVENLSEDFVFDLEQDTDCIIALYGDSSRWAKRD